MNGTNIDWWWIVGLIFVIALIWLLVKNLGPRNRRGSNTLKNPPVDNLHSQSPNAKPEIPPYDKSKKIQDKL